MRGIADPFNGHIGEFRIAHIQRSDGWIETTWNNMSNPGAFAAAAAQEQDGGEPPPPAGAGVVVCLMDERERLVRAMSGLTVFPAATLSTYLPFFGQFGAA